MAKQLLLLHNGVSSYFAGNQQALEGSIQQFNLSQKKSFLEQWDFGVNFFRFRNREKSMKKEKWESIAIYFLFVSLPKSRRYHTTAEVLIGWIEAVIYT